MRRADPHRALLRELAARYPDLVVTASRFEPWASVTFTGARHEIDWTGPTPIGLDQVEFDLPNHLVADIALIGAGRIEVLTIEIG